MPNFGLLDTQAPGRIAGGYWDAADASQNALAKRQQMENHNSLAQTQMQQAQLEQRKFQQQMADDAESVAAYRESGGDFKQVPAALLKRGRGKQAFEALKSQADTQKLRTEAALKGLEYLQKSAAQVYVNPTVDTALATIAQVEAATGRDMTADKNMVMQMRTPDEVQRWADGIGSGINDLRAKIATRDIGGRVQTTMTDPRTGRVTVTDAVTKTPTPGEVLTDSRGRAQLAQAERHFNAAEARARAQEGKPQFNADAGGFVLPPTPQNPSGKFIPVEGVNRNKPLTESQGNATTYGMRIAQANDIIGKLEAKGFTDTGLLRTGVSGTLGAVPVVGDALRAGSDNVFNIAPQILGGLSKEQQALIQAQKNFITAVLRKESGASISPTEYATAAQVYFPSAGDDATVRAQKAEARATALKGMMAQAGPGSAKVAEILKTKPKLSAEDMQAEAWARSNPSDPRAAMIMERLGR